MEHILEHQLKELYSLWNGINGLYTKWAQKKGNVILFRICPVRNLQFRRQMLSQKDMRRVVHAKADRQQHLKKI